MASVDDVAAEILHRTGALDTFKLQKLVYYCQAWHLVWDEEPLFDAPIEAWANGPVCRTLYARHRGRYTVQEWPDGDRTRLSPSELGTIAAVVEAYGRWSGRQLSVLTHSEDPWLNARRGLPAGYRGDAIISLEDMADFYGGLDADPDTEDVEDYAAEMEAEYRAEMEAEYAAEMEAEYQDDIDTEVDVDRYES